MNARALLARTDVRAGIAIVGWAALLMFYSKRPEAGSTPMPVPAPPPVPLPAGGAWRRIAGSAVTLRAGRRYRACFDVPWYVPNAAVTEAAIAKKAASEGFRDVVSQRADGEPCEWMIEATYAGTDGRVMALPSAIPQAWEFA